MSNKNLKTSYSVHHQVESFFTGSSIQFDTSGEHFFCSNGSVVNKVSVDDGQVVAQIPTKNEEDTVVRFALTPNEELIIIAYSSGLITKFNLQDETIEREFKSIHNAPVSCMKVNATNSLLATGSSDGTIKLWNLKNHYCSHNLKGVNGVITCIEFYSTEERELLLCSAGDDNVHVFDLMTSKRITKLSSHCSTITDMKITSDDKHLISVGRDKIAVLWSLDNSNFGSVIRTIPLFESVEAIVILDSDTILQHIPAPVKKSTLPFVTLGEEGVIKFWDAKTGSLICSQNEPPLLDDRSPGSQCIQLCFRPEHDELCAVSAERDIFIYKINNLKLVQQLQGHIDEILSACWFAGNQYIAIACNSNDLKVLELSTSKTEHLKGHSDIVLTVMAVPSNDMCLISSSKDCSILIWLFEPETMKASIIYKATGHTHSIHALALCSAEPIFFSGSEDTTLKKWTFNLDNASEQPEAVGSLIAEHTLKAHDDRIDALAISPNDQIVATGSKDKTCKLFSIDGLKLLATLKGHRRGIYAIQFSPVDQILVTAADTLLRMWNLHDFTCVKSFQGHDCAVLNFSFLSNGLQLLSVGSDGNIKLWDCKSNECIKTIDGHNGNTWVLSMTKDDTLVVTGGEDEKMVVWRDTTAEEQEERLENLQNQVLQEQKFSNYTFDKKWSKALKLAIKMESKPKALNVIREILLDGSSDELENILLKCSLDQLNFVLECCVTWNSTAKNSSIAQNILNILIRRTDHNELRKMPGLIKSLEQLMSSTEKSFSRYERLVQQAYFVDFFFSTIRIQ